MKRGQYICFILLYLIVNIAGCKKSVEIEGIQTLCPEVNSTDPLDKAIDILYDQVIKITFNTGMDSNSINNSTILIQHNATGTILSGKIATTEDPAIYTFTPEAPLLPFNNYALVVKKNAMSLFRIAMISDYSASFTTIPKLTLSSSSAESGKTVGSGNYAQDANVGITAIPSSGYAFVNWTETGTNNIISTSPNFLYSLRGNHNLTANFVPVQVGTFSVYLSSNPAAGGITTGTGIYEAASAVSIKATANNGYTFSHWTENGSIYTMNSSFQISSLTSNRIFVANFNANPLSQLTLSLSSNPISGGTAIGGGAYVMGTSVTINASQFPGYDFVNWTDQFTGNVISNSASYVFVLNTNRNLVANYSIRKYILSTIAVNGTITKNPSQLDYNHGTNVQLTAVPKTGYAFTSWSGDTTSTSNPLTLKMIANKSITANFAAIPPATYTLNITSNNGTVSKNPNQPSYTGGSNVVLTATPIAGYLFNSWSGDTSATSNPISIVMYKNKNITANFTPIPVPTYTLNVVGINGSVTLSPNQPIYTSGASVQLSAIPNAGYTFTSWSGDTSATSNPLIIEMNANKNITANFTVIPITTFTLNTTAVNGTIVKSPNQTNYNSGVTVQLTAVPSAGYTFGSWSGDATGSTNPLSVNMIANKNITANFIVIPPPVALGSIANFGAFGGNAGITNQGVHTVINNGAIGTTAASTLITGFHDAISGAVYTETPLNIGNVTEGIYTAPPAPGTAGSFTTASTALSDANSAFNSISPASKPGGTDPGAGELGGLTLSPGIYKSSIGTFKITNQDLILDAQGDPYAVWIFQTSAGLTVGTPASARNVILRGGAQAKYVFWYVGSAAVINYAGGGTMVGTILATAGVTLSSPANSTTSTAQTILNGRAISLVASVTMVNTIINNQ